MFNEYYKIEVLRDYYDIIFASGNVAVIITLCVLIYQTHQNHREQKHQTEIDSLKVLHSIRCQISYHWGEYLNGQNQGFHFGELLGQYEYACLTCNSYHMPTQAVQCFETEFVETLCRIFSGQNGKDLYSEYLSGPDTFKEIKALLERRADLIETRNSILKRTKS